MIWCVLHLGNLQPAHARRGCGAGTDAVGGVAGLPLDIALPAQQVVRPGAEHTGRIECFPVTKTALGDCQGAKAFSAAGMLRRCHSYHRRAAAFQMLTRLRLAAAAAAQRLANEQRGDQGLGRYSSHNSRGAEEGDPQKDAAGAWRCQNSGCQTLNPSAFTPQGLLLDVTCHWIFETHSGTAGAAGTWLIEFTFQGAVG